MECDGCGNKGFLTKAGLASHQRSSCCRANQERWARQFSKKSEAAAEGSAQGHSTVHDGASVHPNVLKNDEVVRPKEYSQDSTMLLAMIDKDSRSDDSTRRLVDWIRSCNNGKGLSKEATQDFLDVLFHPQFDPKALTVKNAEDVARYEKEHDEELKAYEASLRTK